MLLNTLEFLGYFVRNSSIINTSITANTMQETILILGTECICMLTRNAPKRIIRSSSNKYNLCRFFIFFYLAYISIAYGYPHLFLLTVNSTPRFPCHRRQGTVSVKIECVQNPSQRGTTPFFGSPVLLKKFCSFPIISSFRRK